MSLVFESSVIVDERSGAAAALATSGGRLHLAWTGSDTRVNMLSSLDGQWFGGKQTLPHRSSRRVESRRPGADFNDSFATSTTIEALAPALAGTSQGIHLAWTGNDGRINVWGPALRGGGHEVLRQRSPTGPSLAAWASDIALAWTGNDRRLNLAYSRGGDLGRPLTLAETSFGTPAVCTIGPDLAVAWAGTDRHLNLLVSQQGSFLAPIRLEHTSSAGPALAGIGHELVLAWTGTDRRLNLLVLARGRPPSPPLIPGATSSYAPALCIHDQCVMLAWTGTDTRLNVARLRAPMDAPPPRDR